MAIRSFGIEDAIAFVNELIFRQESRDITAIEIIVLKGAWEDLEYDQIAAKSGYATSYISQDAAPKLWKLLTNALHEKVKKSNFKAVLRNRFKKDATPSANTAEAPILAKDDSPPSLSGAVVAPSNIYIERPSIEGRCYQTLAQPGALVRIKAPKLMGKTSLVSSLLNRFPASTYRTVNLSFDLADRNIHFTDLNKLLQWMCLNISRELGQEDTLDSTWNRELGSKVSCTAYFEKNLLSQTKKPLILCLDNVDLLFPYPTVYEDFFGLLRSWYEKGKTRSHWKNLRLIIVHSTDVYIRLNIHQSPFNVGLAIKIPELSLEQVQALAKQNGLQPDTDQLKDLMEWVGGHPYLLSQLFSFLVAHPEIGLKDILSNEHWLVEIYQNHLMEQWTTLQKQPQLASAFSQIVQSSQPVRLDPSLIHQLRSLGLVKTSKYGAVVRSQLYQMYFEPHLTAVAQP